MSRPARSEERVLSTGLPLHVVSRGSGPPVVLVHGFGASRFTWRSWAPELARGHRVLEIDLKGFGDAPAPRGDESYSPIDQSHLLRDLVLETGLEGATLVGHSLGAAVALLAALELRDVRPESVAGLVVVAGSCYPQDLPPYISLARLPWIGPLVLELAPKGPLMRRVLREIVHDPSIVTAGMVEGYARPFRRRSARRALVRAARQLVPEGGEALIERYGELEVPALLLWGRQDPVVSLSLGERLERELPRGRLEVLEECGHMVVDEHPGRSLALVREFLEGIGTA